MPDPLDKAYFTPLQVTWWYLLEGFIPLGVRSFLLNKKYYIEIMFESYNEDTDELTTVHLKAPDPMKSYSKVRGLMEFWESLGLDP